jgi:hypothetical protein
MELEPLWMSARDVEILKQSPSFRVKALYTKVLHLQSEAGIISVQTGNAALTPLSLKISEREYIRLLRSLPTDRLSLTVRDPKVVDCLLPSQRSIPAAEWIQRLRQLTSVYARDDSLAFAVASPLWSAAPEPTAVQRIAQGILDDAEHYIAVGNYQAGAEVLHALAGLGTGLTPAGDNFLAGVLAVCRRWAVPSFSRLGVMLADSIMESLHKRTWLSAAILQCAVNGEFSPAILDMLTSTNTPALSRAVASGVSCGSSGSDTLGGILWMASTSIALQKERIV